MQEVVTYNCTLPGASESFTNSATVAGASAAGEISDADTAHVSVIGEEVCDGTDNDLDEEVDEGFADTDGDGIADCVNPDDDNDGLSDTDEATAGTDPANPDSDGDGLSDGEEVNTHGTDPLDGTTRQVGHPNR